MKESELKETIRLYALQNAVFYGGKARPQAVLGKVLAGRPELRKRVHVVMEEIEKIVEEVNSLQLEEQQALLASAAPEMMEKEEKKQVVLPDLPNAKPGKVVTRFAPAPTGPLHVSHVVRAAMLSYMYAKKYNGVFILRFEDTDPKKTEKEFYSLIKKDLDYVGIKWDEIVTESDMIELYYKCAVKLIKKKKFYVCICDQDVFREFKKEKRNCPCRGHTTRYNLELWERMLKKEFGEGEAVVRLRSGMKNKNPVLRDPPMLRIVLTPHPRKGKKYAVWPLYNFANAVSDHFNGVTHVFRAKEHEHNTAVQKKIYDCFKWEMPEVINFGLVYLPGEKIHKRDIIEGIRKGVYSGWDDIKLPTIQALKRRGFHPDTFRECSLVCGLSKTDIKLSWENIEGINRKIIDPLANRYMVVTEPVKVELDSTAGIKEIQAPLHPDFPDRGYKHIAVSDIIYISKEDFDNYNGREIRLKGLFNIILDGSIGRFRDNVIRKDMPKIQWVSEPNVNVRIIAKEWETGGLGEFSMTELKVGEIIQMERTGFGRVDKKGREGITIAFAHK